MAVAAREKGRGGNGETPKETFPHSLDVHANRAVEAVVETLLGGP